MIAFIPFIILLVFLIIKRGEVMAIFAKRKFGKGNLKGAIRTFAIAKRFGKLGAPSLMFYGYLLLRDGQLEQGRVILTQASMVAKKTEIKKRIKALLAVCEWKAGDIDMAIEMTEETMYEYETTNLYQNLGLLYVVKGDARKALEINKKAYEYNSDDDMIMDNLASAYVLYGEDEKAVEMYEKLYERKPRFPEAYYGYGQLLIKLGQREKGIALIEESLGKNFSFLSVLQREDVEKMLEEAKSE